MFRIDVKGMGIIFHLYFCYTSLNIYLIPKFSQEIKSLENWKKTFRKPTSFHTYKHALKRLCSEYNLTPQQMAQRSLEEIEAMTEEFIYKYRQIDPETGLLYLSPKYLNLIYLSIQKWCLYHGVIKNRKQFKEILFDKTSRKTRDHTMITSTMFKKMIDHADLKEKLVLGYYGIHALRPSLIPQIRLGDIRQKDICFNPDGTVTLAPKTWIIIKREFLGNKGCVDFPLVLTSEMRAHKRQSHVMQKLEIFWRDIPH